MKHQIRETTENNFSSYWISATFCPGLNFCGPDFQDKCMTSQVCLNCVRKTGLIKLTESWNTLTLVALTTFSWDNLFYSDISWHHVWIYHGGNSPQADIVLTQKFLQEQELHLNTSIVIFLSLRRKCVDVYMPVHLVDIYWAPAMIRSQI